MSLGIPIKESVFIETNIKDNCNYNICESCNGKMTATLIWEDGTVKTHPTFVGTRRFCDECKKKKNKEKYQSKRKNKNYKKYFKIGQKYLVILIKMLSLMICI